MAFKRIKVQDMHQDQLGIVLAAHAKAVGLTLQGGGETWRLCGADGVELYAGPLVGVAQHFRIVAVRMDAEPAKPAA